MMKRKCFLNGVSLLFAFLFLLCSCQESMKTGALPDPEGTKTSISAEIGGEGDAPSPTTPPPQPIRFDSFESARNFILSADLSAYSKEEREAYEKMNRVFREDGFLYLASCQEKSIPARAITLFPEAGYEDTGIGCWFVIDDVWYQFIVYHVRAGKERAVVEDAWKINDEGTREIEVNANSTSVKIPFRYWTQEKETFYFGYLDDRHYFLIEGEASADRIAEVIRGVSFEKSRFEKTEKEEKRSNAFPIIGASVLTGAGILAAILLAAKKRKREN